MTTTPTPAPDAAEIEALIPKLETLRLHLRDGLDHDADAELVAVAIADLRSLSRPVDVTDAMVSRAFEAQDAAEVEALIARIENDGPFFDCIGEPVAELEVDIIAALRSLSRPVRVTDAWQSIETAPKEGSIVLVWPGPYGRVVLSRWSVDHLGVGACKRLEPTHWRPLPEPPAALTGETK